MHIREFLSFPLTAVGGLFLVALLFWLLAQPGTAQETLPFADKPAARSSTADSKDFTLLGVYTRTDGYSAIGPVDVSSLHAYASFGQGLHVLNISNPAAVQHLGEYDTPQASVQAIERDGGLLYISLDRPSGFGGDDVEFLSTDPITKPTLLGT